MKWAVIGIIALVVLGAAGYGIYRWTSVPEQAKEWMDEQDLKNFPTQARRELDTMRKDLEDKKKVKRDLEKDIIAREGRDDWDETALKAETNGMATLIWYDRQVNKYEKAIKDVVTQVKEQEEKLVAAGTVDAETGKIPADHEFAITSANGKELKWTRSRAIQETDKMALEVKKFQRKADLQKRVVSKKKEYVTKLDSLITKMEGKIDEMQAFIEEMEVEIELLELEKDIADVNAAISGQDNGNRFGAAINKFRTKQKEFLAEQELAEKEAPKDDSYFSETDDNKEDGASAGYWG
jgi:hypothetical protein